MSEKTGIEWTDATWNPTRGCSKVSEGCRHCYAMRVAARFSGPGQPYEGLARRTAQGPEWTGEVRFVEDALGLPLSWRAPRRVFVDSMSDLFHEKVSDSQVLAVFDVMARAPRHTFQVLTKRPERMMDFCRRLRWYTGRSDKVRTVGFELQPKPEDEVAVLPNVWLGTSVENQAAADGRIPHLLATPAAVRFLSCEPLLGPVDLTIIPGLAPHVAVGATRLPVHSALAGLSRVDWVIVGGESGPDARPCDVEWVRGLVRQCKAAGVACFVKQLGALPWAESSVGPPGFCEPMELKSRKGGDMEEWPIDLRVRQFPVPVPAPT